jgi:hypothetical protein
MSVFVRFSRQYYLLQHPEVRAPNAMLLSKRMHSNFYFIPQASFVGAFTQVAKSAHWLHNVCLSVCLRVSARAALVRLSVKFDIGGLYKNLTRKSKFC